MHLYRTPTDYKGLLWIIPREQEEKLISDEGGWQWFSRAGTQQVTDRPKIKPWERPADFQTFVIFSRVPAVVAASCAGPIASFSDTWTSPWDKT